MSTRIIPILALVFALALFFGYINPTYQGSISQKNAQIKGYQSALDASKRFAAKEAQLATASAAIPADGLARLGSFLPDGVNNVQLILDLNALAARSGLTLSNFSIDTSAADAATANNNAQPLALTANKPVDSLDISVQATGTYAAFRTFMRGIEQSLRPLDITSVSVASAANGVYVYDVSMRIYWLH